MKGDEKHIGEAQFSKNIVTEQSPLNKNYYEAYEFIENNDYCRRVISIGTDSIGSGNRLLLKYEEKCNNKLIKRFSSAN